MAPEGISPLVAELQTRPKEVIRQELEQVGLDFKIARREWDAELSKLPDNKQQEIEEKAEDIILGKAGVRDIAGENYSSPEEASAVSRLTAIASKLAEAQVRYEKLSKEDLPYLKSEVTDLISTITGQVDFESIFEFYGIHENTTATGENIDKAFSEVRYARSEARAIEQNLLDHRQLVQIKNSLTEIEQKWKERGFLKFPEYAQTTEQQPPSREQLLADAQEIHTNLQNYRRLAKIYRAAADQRNDHETYQVDNLDTQLRRTDQESMFEIPGFSAALANHLAKIKARNAAAGRLPGSPEVPQATQQDVARSISGINFEGLEAPQGHTLVVDAEFLRSQTAAFIPARFIENLSQVIRVDQPENLFPDQEDPNKPGVIIETSAVHIATFKKDPWDSLENSRIEMYKEAWVDEGEEVFFEVATKRSFMGTYWHEFAHRIHQSLTFDEMQEWEQIIQGDPIAVSDYVERSRSSSSRKGKVEDFADSFKMLMQSPLQLDLMSEKRYGFMRQVLDKYQSPEQRVAFAAYQKGLIETTRAAQKELGIDEAELRNMYRKDIDNAN